MHESTIITILLFLFIIIITFCLINKHHKSLTEHYSKTTKPASGSFKQSCRKCTGKAYFEKGYMT
jgi:amino acid permease